MRMHDIQARPLDFDPIEIGTRRALLLQHGAVRPFDRVRLREVDMAPGIKPGTVDFTGKEVHLLVTDVQQVPCPSRLVHDLVSVVRLVKEYDLPLAVPPAAPVEEGLRVGDQLFVSQEGALYLYRELSAETEK